MSTQKYAVKAGKKAVAYYESESDANAARPTYGEDCTVELVTVQEDDGGKTTTTSKTETSTTSTSEDPTSGGKKKP